MINSNTEYEYGDKKILNLTSKVDNNPSPCALAPPLCISDRKKYDMDYFWPPFTIFQFRQARSDTTQHPQVVILTATGAGDDPGTLTSVIWARRHRNIHQSYPNQSPISSRSCLQAFRNSTSFRKTSCRDGAQRTNTFESWIYRKTLLIRIKTPNDWNFYFSVAALCRGLYQSSYKFLDPDKNTFSEQIAVCILIYTKRLVMPSWRPTTSM